MPVVTAIIDDLRAAFGADVINLAIKRGIDGFPTFYAREASHEIGTRYVGQGTAITGAQMHLGSFNPKARR